LQVASSSAAAVAVVVGVEKLIDLIKKSLSIFKSIYFIYLGI
jgi:hypothetical protein